MTGIHFRTEMGLRNLCGHDGRSYSTSEGSVTCQTCLSLLSVGINVPSFERVSHFDLDDVADEFGVNLKEKHMNPLDNYPQIRSALYLIQWLVTGVQTVLSAAFAFALGSPESWPFWFLLGLAVTPVLWAYLGVTAQSNVTAVRREPVEVSSRGTINRIRPKR